jgi:hypothetical protein
LPLTSTRQNNPQTPEGFTTAAPGNNNGLATHVLRDGREQTIAQFSEPPTQLSEQATSIPAPKKPAESRSFLLYLGPVKSPLRNFSSALVKSRETEF